MSILNVVSRLLISALILATAIGPTSADSAGAETQSKSGTSAGGADVQRSVEPGPLKKMREQLMGQIVEAEKRGVGVKNYLVAFQQMESAVKAGASEAVVKQKIMSIISSLHQQMRASSVLKRQALQQLSSGGGGGASSSSPAGGSASVGQMESIMFGLINRDRKLYKLSALSRNSKLDMAARAHSQDMVRRNFLEHVNPDGLDPSQRAKKQGVNGTIGENIGFVARNRDNDSIVMIRGEKMLMSSPTHRANLLNPSFRSVGVGVATDQSGDLRVTQLFSVQ